MKSVGSLVNSKEIFPNREGNEASKGVMSKCEKMHNEIQCTGTRKDIRSPTGGFSFQLGSFDSSAKSENRRQGGFGRIVRVGSLLEFLEAKSPGYASQGKGLDTDRPGGQVA